MTPLTMTLLVMAGMELPAAEKMLVVKKSAALIPLICWKNMRPTATSSGFSAHHLKTSVKFEDSVL